MSTSLENLVGNMTVSDLARVAGLEIEDVVTIVLGRATPKPARTRTASRSRGPARRAPRPAVKPNPRGNRDERAAAYTEKVRAAIVNAKAPVSSSDIRAKAGGNTARCGLAIKRLVAAGVVTHDGGKTSARRYSAA